MLISANDGEDGLNTETYMFSFLSFLVVTSIIPVTRSPTGTFDQSTDTHIRSSQTVLPFTLSICIQLSETLIFQSNCPFPLL